MKTVKFLLYCCMLFLFSSCTTSAIITSWKSDKATLKKYNKILVVGIIRDTGLQLRRQMENHFVNDLKGIGYNAVSALTEFGPKGLAHLEQEQTYNRLCNKGIDAVLTIALLDKAKEKYYVPAQVRYYSSLYYYNRIWNYKTIQANLVDTSGFYAETTKFLWESILFDLAALTPVYSVQTSTFDPASTESMAHEYGKLIVAHMQKHKIITPQPAAVATPPKTF